MEFLWSQPKIIASIIKNSELDILKKYLAPLFIDNFYDNLFSKYSVENNLIYLLSLLLKSEIINCSNCDSFLNDTPCSVLFEQLRKKSDIQNYFKKITEKVIINLENNYNSIKINFNDKEELLFTANKKTNEILDANLMYKYLQDPKKEILLDCQNKFKDNKIIFDFFDLKIKDFISEPNIYSTEKIRSFLIITYSINIVNSYYFNFMIVMNFIDEIIQSIFDNISSIPYSIKCFCKIIYILVRNKFDSSKSFLAYIFITKFFFGSFLIPYLTNPKKELFMSDLLSKNNLKNLIIIFIIFNRYILADFFKSNKEEEWMYIPFNMYFIKNIPKIFILCDKIKNVELPKFIELLINDKLDKNYKYDYFNENENQIFYYRSIYFYIEQMNVLIDTIKNKKSQIALTFNDEQNSKEIEIKLDELVAENKFDILKSLNYLEQYNNEAKMNNINDNGNSNKGHKVIYYIFASLEVNKNYKYFLEFKNSINELNFTSNENGEMKLYIIKIKNMLCDLLCNIDNLDEIHIDKENSGNTENILEQLYSILLIANNEIEYDINNKHQAWLCKSILECLKKLPHKYKENDYGNIYDDLNKEINKSIEDLNFGVLNEFISKIKLAKQKKIYYKNIIKELDELELNDIAQKIINNTEIKVSIYFKNKKGSKKNCFHITNKPILNINDKYKNNCQTIKNFIEKFRKLINFEEIENLEIFILNLPKQIKEYFQIIEANLKKVKITDVNLIQEKIKEYIMINIYKNIFRKKATIRDEKFFDNCFKVSWVELNNFINPMKELFFGNFENEIREYFISLTIEKSIFKKFIYLNKIFESIEVFQNFNDINNSVTPILKYFIIKSMEKDMMFYSNFEFMELYLDLIDNKTDIKNKFDIFKNVCNDLLNFDYKYLINITKEEFDKKCNDQRNSLNK